MIVKYCENCHRKQNFFILGNITKHKACTTHIAQLSYPKLINTYPSKLS